jgi:hypothetical protein
MAKIPTWIELMDYVGDVMKANALIWQQFLVDAQTGNATAAIFFQDAVLTGTNWMSVYALIIGAGGSPVPPTAFILGTPWPNTSPTKSATARLEVPLNQVSNPLVYEATLTLVGGGTNTYPLTLAAEFVDGSNGGQIKIDVSRSGTSGQDPTSGMHVGTIYTAGEVYVSAVLVVVP